MRNARHITRSGGATASARGVRRAVACLVLVPAAGASCTVGDVVRPRDRVALGRAAAGPGSPVRSQRVQVASLSDGHPVRGSSAILKRRGDGLTVRVRTAELDPGESVDVFWAVFNDPAACTHPNPLTGAPCSPPDLFVGATRGSLHYVATLTADARGRLSYSASLATGSTAGCVGDPFPCHTLTDPFAAEIHSPLFVPNGGAGRQAAQFVAPQY